LCVETVPVGISAGSFCLVLIGVSNLKKLNGFSKIYRKYFERQFKFCFACFYASFITLKNIKTSILLLPV